jgi:hypothetical protein
MPARPRPDCFAIEGTITLRMVLAEYSSAPALPGISIREIARDEVAGFFAQSGLMPSPIVDLDAIAPLGWRCFAAFEGDCIVHHSFVAERAEGPELFRVLTVESHRRRGLFRSMVGGIAHTLRSEGRHALQSKAGVSNPLSVQAHRRAGFAIVHRRYEVVVLGVNLMRTASKVRRRLFPRPGERDLA